MGHREYAVIEIVDVFRRVLEGDSFRLISRSTGMDRNTLRTYLRIAEKHGFGPGFSGDLDDIAYAVYRTVHPDRSRTEALSQREQILIPYEKKIAAWLKQEKLTLTKVHIKLRRMGVAVSYSSLYRFARERLDFGSKKMTVRMMETEPGEVAEVDFGRLGIIYDPGEGRNRVLRALVVTLVYSRYQYVFTTHTQDLKTLIKGIEEAWEFFGGCVRRVILDNLRTAVVKASRYEPIFQRTFFEYSRYRGFIIDATRVRDPQGKPHVERQIPYVRNNFFKGETFIDRDHAQREAIRWCQMTAGLRIHGTIRRRPRPVFENEEQQALVPLTQPRFDVPQWLPPHTVHPDHHIRVNYAAYSVPTAYIGRQVDVRVDSKLVRIYHKEQLIKTHPVKPPGERSTDYTDYPKEKTPYAMRSCEYYIKKAGALGPSCGRFAQKLLSGDYPWSKLRQAQKLLSLAKKYGAQRVDKACERALYFDLLNIYRVENIIKTVHVDVPLPEDPVCSPTILPGRFCRPAHYFHHPIQEAEDAHQ